VSLVRRFAIPAGSVAAFVFLAVAATLGGDDPAELEGSLTFDQLAVGACYDEPNDWWEVDGSFLWEEIDAVRCEDPHDSEVFHIFELETATVPDEQEIGRIVDDVCVPEFETYVGHPYRGSELDITYSWPSPEGWDEGDRTAMCAAFAADLDKLEGSVKHSRR
jgi:hypothetical protein